jgi:basic membrane protein A
MKAGRIVVAALVGAILSFGCSKDDVDDNTPTEQATKVGFIYVGPVGDYGWTKSQDDGRNYLEAYGKNVKTTYFESVAPADAPAKIDQLVADGNTIIFTTSFDFLSQALDSHNRHPDTWVLNCAGFKTAPHTGNYQARIEETEYLSGMVAGEAAKRSGTNKIGVVGALWIYEQMMHMNAFTLGARSVNPDVKVYVRWVGAWFNPAMEAKAAQDLVAQGCDVIKSFTDTNIPLTTADSLSTADGKKVHVVAHGNKAACSGVENCLVTAYYNWGPLYVKLVDEIREGKYPTAGRIDYLGSADLDIVGLEWPANDLVPQEVKDEVEARRQQIIAKQLNVFQGPFNDAAGDQWMGAGQTLTDHDLICTSKFVDGIEVLAGPACGSDADCNTPDLPAAAIACVQGSCVATDMSGCEE